MQRCLELHSTQADTSTSVQLCCCRRALDAETQRVAFYPGSDSKFQRFKQTFQGVEEHGAAPMHTNGFKTSPWLLKTGLSPDQVREKIKSLRPTAS